MTDIINPYNSGPLNIMVVDDEQDACSLYLQHFRKEIKDGSLLIHYAPSAEEALTALNRPSCQNIRLIFSDINMPGMSGLDLLKIIKEKFHQMKVVMVTAYGTDKYRHNANACGADGFFTKPVNFNLVKEYLSQIPA